MQDCQADYRNLDRVYVPLDALAAVGAKVEELGHAQSSPALRECLRGLAVRTGKLLDQSAPFSPLIGDFRLAMEVAVIQSLARRLVAMLTTRDPLSERVHLGAAGFAAVGILGMVQGLALRLLRPAIAAPMGNKIP